MPDRHDVSCRQSMQALIKSRVPRSPFRARRLLRWRARACGPKKLRFLLMALFCMRTLVASAQTDSSTGSVRGILRLLDSDGTTYVAGGTIVLIGQLKQQTEADQEGRYAFEGLPPGTYRIEAIASGLRAERSIVVEPDKITNADLELKPTEVQSTVTVTASANDGKMSASSETISEQTLRDAPNVNERFESATDGSWGRSRTGRTHQPERCAKHTKWCAGEQRKRDRSGYRQPGD